MRNLRDTQKKCKDQKKESDKSQKFCQIGVVEEVAKPPPEYHYDDTSHNFQEHDFEENKEN